MSKGGESRNGTGSGEAARIPRLRQGVDPAAFRLDPISTGLLTLLDGRASMGEIASASGLEPAVVIDRLKALVAAGLVALSGDSLPPAAARRADPAEPERPSTRAAEQAWAKAVTGDLADKPAIAVLEEAAASAFGGAIRFERQGERIDCHFAKGQPLGVVSSADRHEHGVMLQAAGKITAEHLKAYREARSAGAAHAVAALIKAGVSDRKQLALHLTWRGSAILKELAGWRDGRYAIAAGLPYPEGLEQLRLLLPRQRKATSWRSARLDEEQLAVLETNRAKYLVASASAGQLVSGLGLDDKELRYVKHILAEPIQLSQAFATSTLLRAVTKSLLYHLIRGGAFEMHDVNPAGITPHALQDLGPHLHKLEKDTHFNVLTAHPVSTVREIRQRHARRTAEYDPALYPEAGPEHLEILAAIRARLDRALEVLGDRQQRQEYRRQVCGRDQLLTFLDLQLRKAEVALKMRGQAEEAIELASSALDIEPASIAARLLLAEALAHTGRVREAREQLQGVGAIPADLRQDYESLRRRLG
jgi:tetratricopeptide (TPR) repeat protein